MFIYVCFFNINLIFICILATFSENLDDYMYKHRGNTASPKRKQFCHF